MSFINWNDRVLQLLEEIRNNSSPVGEGAGAVNIKVNDVLVSSANPVPVGDNGGTITVDGAVQIANFPASQVVSGSVQIANFPASQVVSGSVQVANFPASQLVEGSVEIANFPASQLVEGAVQVENLPAIATLYSNLGTAAAGVAKASAGELLALCGHNLSTVGTRYLQVFDRAAAPETGAVPVLFFPVFSGNSFVIGNQFFGALGIRFSSGIAWAWSTTAKTYSAVASPSEHATFITLL